MEKEGIILLNTLRLMLIAVMLLVTGFVFAQNSLLINGDFETGTGDFPDAWEKNFWEKGSDFTECTWRSEGAQSGNRCMMLNSYKVNDARLAQEIRLSKNTKYQFSCWVKTENVSETGTGANLSLIDELVTSERIHGTNGQWQELVLYIQNDGAARPIKVALCLGGYGEASNGIAWFDNAKLIEVASIPATATVFYSKDSIKENKPGAKSNSSWIITLVIIIAGIILVFILILVFIKSADKKESSSKDEPANTTDTNE